MDPDSVPLEVLAAPVPACAFSVKKLLALFFIFLIVMSRTFTSSVLNAFGEKAVSGSTPTAWGTVLQDVALVAGYAVTAYLIDNGTL